MKKGTARFGGRISTWSRFRSTVPLGMKCRHTQGHIFATRSKTQTPHHTTHTFSLSAVLAVGDACSSTTVVEGEYHAAMIACWHTSPSRVSKDVEHHVRTSNLFLICQTERHTQLRDGNATLCLGGDGAPCQFGCRQAPSVPSPLVMQLLRQRRHPAPAQVTAPCL